MLYTARTTAGTNLYTIIKSACSSRTRLQSYPTLCDPWHHSKILFELEIVVVYKASKRRSCLRAIGVEIILLPCYHGSIVILAFPLVVHLPQRAILFRRLPKGPALVCLYGTL